jgi:hypothetical protein
VVMLAAAALSCWWADATPTKSCWRAVHRYSCTYPGCWPCATTAWRTGQCMLALRPAGWANKESVVVVVVGTGMHHFDMALFGHVHGCGFCIAVVEPWCGIHRECCHCLSSPMAWHGSA